ncbi:conjugal transfer protein TraE [Christensenellaceae bacterium OttesenSCG-928-M15]|nr:conjugal transfer protein TraE [Christensenellaceae bacterium OttesenSCG-928-M15]
MHRDGVCRVTNKLYTKTILFGDLNYQLAQNEDKNAIFESYCDFLNYFDSSVHVQLTFLNKRANIRDFERSIEIPGRADQFDSIRTEYADMLKNQLAKGRNGIVREKYITFGVEAASLKEAKPRLERIEADVLSNFKTLGASARALTGAERLELLHGQLHPDGQEKLRFDWKDIIRTGMSTKDFIAPSSFDFRDSKTFRVGEHYGAISFIQIMAPELSDRMLAEFFDLDTTVTVNLHIRSIDQAEAIKTVKRKLTDLDAMKIAEQKKAVRAGYDMDILPADLQTYGTEAMALLNDLQSRNERMFLVTALVMNTAKKRRKLDNDAFAAAGVVQKFNCAMKRLDFCQEQGLVSSLALGLNQVEILRGLTTSSTAIFVPFTTCELFQGGEALYYGLNPLSNNIIMADRKLLKAPNGLFLGTPGSGKSFSAKREIVNVFLMTDDDIIVSDPEGEYHPLITRLGGQVVKLSPTSTQYQNPMDINLNYSEEEDPLTLKSDFILSLCELIVGGKDGLQPVEKTIIDRCTRLVYRDYLIDPSPEKMPILGDLYELLRAQPEAEAQRLATSLEIYVVGSLNVFNHRTNIKADSRLLCYDIKELGKGLKKIAMLILQDAVWNRVTVNRAARKTTWFYIDEMHLLLKEEQTAAYTVEIWKRFRKWGGIPSGLTQNVKDLLASREIENIFENSDFVYLLNQAPGDRSFIAKQLGISPHQLSYVTHSGAGEGLMIYGSTIIPFVDHFPKDTEIYSLLTSKPSEMMAA